MQNKGLCRCSYGKEQDETLLDLGALTPMTGVLIRYRKEEDTERRPCEDGGRGWRDAATSPEAPGTPRSGRGRKDPLLEPPEGAWPCGTLISDPDLQNWERIHFVVLSLQVCSSACDMAALGNKNCTLFLL